MKIKEFFLILAEFCLRQKVQVKSAGGLRIFLALIRFEIWNEEEKRMEFNYVLTIAMPHFVPFLINNW